MCVLPNIAPRPVCRSLVTRVFWSREFFKHVSLVKQEKIGALPQNRPKPLFYNNLERFRGAPILMGGVVLAYPPLVYLFFFLFNLLTYWGYSLKLGYVPTTSPPTKGKFDESV